MKFSLRAYYSNFSSKVLQIIFLIPKICTDVTNIKWLFDCCNNDNNLDMKIIILAAVLTSALSIIIKFPIDDFISVEATGGIAIQLIQNGSTSLHFSAETKKMFDDLDVRQLGNVLYIRFNQSGYTEDEKNSIAGLLCVNKLRFVRLRYGASIKSQALKFQPFAAAFVSQGSHLRVDNISANSLQLDVLDRSSVIFAVGNISSILGRVIYQSIIETYAVLIKVNFIVAMDQSRANFTVTDKSKAYSSNRSTVYLYDNSGTDIEAVTDSTGRVSTYLSRRQGVMSLQKKVVPGM